VAIVAVLSCASTAAAITPNDPVWEQSWGQQQVGMTAAWDITKGDPNVIIAVVDTGVDPNVPDLQGALVPGWDFVTNSYTVQDTGGHGTLSGTIAVGRGNNGIGMAGYCWGCRLMPVRVAASGTGFDGYLSSLGIRWAVDHGARIISIGFSDEGTFSTPEPQVAAAIAYAAQHNVLVIASAGNTGTTVLTHPASDFGAYPIAATDRSDVLYPWSTFGSWVGLAAPGCHWAYSAAQTGAEIFCGSSTSAPAVAGLAGLMLSVNSSLTPVQIVDALRQTAVPVAGIAGGRVNAYNALLAVGGTPPRPRPARLQPPKRRPNAKPAATTRVQKGFLRAHWHVTIKVWRGRIAVTLRSPKAKSCTISLKSGGDLWFSDRHKRNSVVLAARVPAGRYSVDVWCRVHRPRRSALQLRALFD
jgi:thermitase